MPESNAIPTRRTLPHRTLAHRTLPHCAVPLLAGALALLLAAAAAPGPVHAQAPTGREIMQRVLDRDEGETMVADMTMVLIDRNGNRRERRLRNLRKEIDETTDHTLLFFEAPADVKGTGFLTYDYREQERDDDQWLYLPALQKTRRIAGADKSGSFMGSDFNYSDLSSPDLDEYDYTLMQEAEVDGHMTWQIEAVPKEEATAEETGYERSVLWVRQDNHVIVRAVRWVYQSQRRKFMQVKRLEEIEGIWTPLERQMVTREGNTAVHATVLTLSNVDYGRDLPDSTFTVRQLEKGL